MARIPNTLVPCREGDWLLITTGQGYWAKGPTIAEAKYTLGKTAHCVTDKRWRVRSVHPNTEVTPGGAIRHPRGHEPLTIAEYDPQ